MVFFAFISLLRCFCVRNGKLPPRARRANGENVCIDAGLRCSLVTCEECRLSVKSIKVIHRTKTGKHVLRTTGMSSLDLWRCRSRGGKWDLKGAAVPWCEPRSLYARSKAV